jgi:hypothetical protein
MILYCNKVIMGSFNFTKAAQGSNAESRLVRLRDDRHLDVWREGR